MDPNDQTIELVKHVEQRKRKFNQDTSSDDEDLKEVFKPLVPNAGVLSTQQAGKQVEDLTKIAKFGVDGFKGSSFDKCHEQRITAGSYTFTHKQEIKREKMKPSHMHCISLTESLPEADGKYFGEFVAVSGALHLKLHSNSKAGSKKVDQAPKKEDKQPDINVCIYRCSLESLPHLHDKSRHSNSFTDHNNALFRSLISADSTNPTVDLYNISVFVTGVPLVGSKNLKNPSQLLMVIGSGASTNKLQCDFMIAMKSDIQAEEKKKLLDQCIFHTNVNTFVENCFNAQEVDLQTLMTETAVHLAFITVAKQSLARKKDKSKATKAHPLPTVVIVVVADKIGTLQPLTEEEHLKAPQGYLSTFKCPRDQVVKFSGMPHGEVMVDLREFMALKGNKTKDFCTATLTRILLKGEVPNANQGESPVNFAHSIGTSTRTTLKFTSETHVHHTVNSKSYQFFASTILNDQAVYKPEKEIHQQLENVKKQGFSISSEIVCMSSALSVYFKSGSKEIDALKATPFQCTAVDPVGQTPRPLSCLSNKVYIEELADSNCVDVPGEGENFEILNAKNFAYADYQCLCDMDPFLNLFMFVHRLLRCAMSSAKFMSIQALCLATKSSGYVNKDIFHDAAAPLHIKSMAFEHFIMTLFVNIFYTVDILYGKPNNLALGWLKVHFVKDGSISARQHSLKDLLSLVIADDSWGSVFRNGKFSNYDENINPRKVVFILAVMHGISLGTKEFDEIVNEVKACSMEDIKKRAYDYIDSIWKFRVEKIPFVDKDGKVTPLAFKDGVDNFVEHEDIFTGPVPQDFELYGACSFPRARIEVLPEGHDDDGAS